jgi:hypothetical protein
VKADPFFDLHRVFSDRLFEMIETDLIESYALTAYYEQSGSAGWVGK